jgi:putative flippase GtrA
MNEFAQKIAVHFGFEHLYERHGHHIPRMTKVFLVGGTGFILQTIIFETLGIWLKVVSPSTATIIGAECAIISNFFLNERYSFRDTGGNRAPFFKRIAMFHLVSSGSLLAQWLSLFFMEHLTSSPLWLNAAFIFGAGVGFITNYTGYYFFVWRKG